MKTTLRIVVAIVLAGCSSDGSTPIDGAPGVDTPIVDTPTPISCGLSYAPLTGGQTGHKYLEQTTIRTQVDQAGVCALGGGYLAIPDDANELAALATKANGIVAWVGVDDKATEGSFVDAKGNPYTAFTVMTNSAGADCVQATAATQLNAIPCTDLHITICECEH